MKKIYILLFLFSAFFACDRCDQRKSEKEELASIKNMLTHYFTALENEDYQKIESSWKQSDSIVMLGTNSTDNLVGWERVKNAYREQFELVSDFYISISDQYIRINSTGNTAWFSQLMSYNFMIGGVAQSYDGLRFTGVLEKCNNEWKLVQGHLSVPANVDIGKK